MSFDTFTSERPEGDDLGSDVIATKSPEGYVHDLWIWHLCDMSVEGANGREPFWRPGGVGLHTLVSREPLHLEPSIYWVSCCGKHGWVRDGRWVSA